MDKLISNFKMEHNFSKKVVSLIDLISFKPDDIVNINKKKNSIPIDMLIEWFDKLNINDDIHIALLNYKPIANATELMEKGFKGKELGEEIKRIEIEHFKQLIYDNTII